MDVLRSKNTVRSSVAKNTDEMRNEINDLADIEQLQKQDKNIINSISAIEDIIRGGTMKVDQDS